MIAEVFATMCPQVAVLLTCVLGGAIGTATFTYQVGTAAPSSTLTTQAALVVPGTILLLNLSGTWIAGDTYTIAASGTLSHTGTGPASGVTPLNTFPGSLYPAGTTFALGPAVQYAESQPPRIAWVPTRELWTTEGMGNRAGSDPRQTGRPLLLCRTYLDVYLWSADVPTNEALKQAFLQAGTQVMGHAPNVRDGRWGFEGEARYENTEANDVQGVELVTSMWIQGAMTDQIHTPSPPITAFPLTEQMVFPDGNTVVNA